MTPEIVSDLLRRYSCTTCGHQHCAHTRRNRSMGQCLDRSAGGRVCACLEFRTEGDELLRYKEAVVKILDAGGTVAELREAIAKLPK